MPGILRALAAICFCFGGAAFAQQPQGFELFYEGPTNANLGGRPVVADIALYADMDAAAAGDLEIALVTNVTKFIAETERDLENWVATNQNPCGERWRAGAPQISFPPSRIRFALELELEVWNCGWNGKGAPGRLGATGGTIDVTLEPFVEDGKLQARLDQFLVTERSGVSRFLPLEFVARRVVNAELKKLNENTKFYRAPEPLLSEGLVYRSIRGAVLPDDSVVITARYRGDGDEAAFERLAGALRTDGLTQE